MHSEQRLSSETVERHRPVCCAIPLQVEPNRPKGEGDSNQQCDSSAVTRKTDDASIIGMKELVVLDC